MKNPLVSVIVPTRNSAGFLSACLTSIKNQTYKNIEIVIVDNYSTDKTKIIAKSLRHSGERRDSRIPIKFYSHGPERSAQRNFGAKKSRGKYIYFVDSDFLLDKNIIHQCVAKITEGYDAIVVHNTPDETVSWIAKIRKFEVDMYKYDLTHSAARFFKKSIYRKIKGYDERITAGEDYDIQNRLNRNGYKTGFIDAEAIHLGEPKSFWKHMLKYYKYGKDFENYSKQNRKETVQQLNFFRKVYFKNWKKFIKNPFLSTTFIIYLICKYVAGATGFIKFRYEMKNN